MKVPIDLPEFVAREYKCVNVRIPVEGDIVLSGGRVMTIDKQITDNLYPILKPKKLIDEDELLDAIVNDETDRFDKLFARMMVHHSLKYIREELATYPLKRTMYRGVDTKYLTHEELRKVHAMSLGEQKEKP